jgi:integrase/recombinase XerD
LRGGGNIYTLSKILGHSSVTMTEKQYVHLLSEDLVKLSEGVRLGIAS